MKKFIIMMLASVLFFGMQACKEKPQVTWAGEVSCQADGLVEGTFPTGTFAFNGNGSARVTTNSSSDTKVFGTASEDFTDLSYARRSNDNKMAAAAEEVNAFFVITKAEGKYHVLFDGYVEYGPFKFRVTEELPKTDTTAVTISQVE